MRTLQDVGQQCGKGPDLGVVLTQGCGNLPYPVDETPVPPGSYSLDQPSPSRDITAHDDILDGGFGEGWSKLYEPGGTGEIGRAHV